MRLIDSHTVSELDKKIEYLLQEKSCVLEDELRMTNEVIKKIKLSYPTSYDLNPHYQSPKNKIILKKQKYIALLGISILIPVLLIAFSSNVGFATNIDDNITSRYLTQNLHGDTVDTWGYWDIPANRSLYVGIINANLLNSEYYDVLESAILSEETLSFDKSLFYKAPKGTDEVYHLGWKGALNSISTSKYTIPSNLQIISPENPQYSADILITLTTQRDPEGISGYTKSNLERNNILKSYITIYEVDKISKNHLSAIVRHEFGHALGLAHSTAPEDLMFPDITTVTPYISECDVSAISSLYEGNRQSEVVCEI